MGSLHFDNFLFYLMGIWGLRSFGGGHVRTDIWKFTLVSYRTSALWGRCPKKRKRGSNFPICESKGHQLLWGRCSIGGTTNRPSNRRTNKVGRRVANQATNNFQGSLRRLDCVCYAIIIFTIQYLTHIQPSYLRPRPKKGSRTFWMLRMGSFGHIFAKVH